MATITIATVIDAVGALTADTLSGSTYLMDTNKMYGSIGVGTENLQTLVNKDDELIWTVWALEVEVYVAIKDIIIDSKYCQPEEMKYDGTDISYWVGEVKRNIREPVSYQIKFQVGNRKETMTLSTPFLIGRS
ncbi:MAG: hypothetical protein F6K16_01255 [Symploca sp. SIO2B6]|nr:hypothetical protein [Symploca sp. SIO2B6]